MSKYLKDHIEREAPLGQIDFEMIPFEKVTSIKTQRWDTFSRTISPKDYTFYI
jgi:hypothetical protein